jgi:hypothetical protein
LECLNANANVATVLRSVSEKRKTKRDEEKEKRTFLAVLDDGGGVGANSREPMSVVFFFKYPFYAIVCLFMLEKSFIYTFFYNNCMGNG